MTKVNSVKRMIINHLKMPTILWAGFTIIFLLIYSRHMSWVTIRNIMLISAMYSYGLGGGCGLISSICYTRYNWITQTRKVVTLLLSILIPFVLLSTLLIQYIIVVHLYKNPVSSLFESSVLWMYTYTVIMALGITSFFIAKSFIQEWKKSVKEEERLRAENIEAKYEALKNQTDPHFFFNSLNVLSSLIDEDRNLAQKFITELSRIYRYVLDKRNHEIATIEEELKFAEEYINLQSIRFEGAVECNVNVDEEFLKYSVPTLALQLILENIFKHNTISDSYKMNIEVGVSDNKLYIQNSKKEKKVFGRKSGVGISNLRERYTFFTKDTLEIEDLDNTYRISIPLLN